MEVKDAAEGNSKKSAETTRRKIDVKVLHKKINERELTWERKLDQLKDQNKKLEEALNIAKLSEKAVESELSERKEHIERMKLQLQLTKAQNNGLKEKIASKSMTASDYHKKLTDVTTENLHIKVVIQRLTAENKELKNDVLRLQDLQRKSMDTKVDAAETKVFVI